MNCIEFDDIDVFCIIFIFYTKVREAVSRYGVEQTQALRAANPGLNAAYVAQMPTMISTLTDLRKLYLRPGVNMRRAGEHPQSLTDPRYPDGNTDTTLEWLPGKLQVK